MTGKLGQASADGGSGSTPYGSSAADASMTGMFASATHNPTDNSETCFFFMILTSSIIDSLGKLC
jgi:hypothetical protein